MDIRTKGLNHLCFPTYYRGPFVASNIANMYCTELLSYRTQELPLGSASPVLGVMREGLNHLCFPTYYRGPFVASNIANLPLDLRSILAMTVPVVAGPLAGHANSLSAPLQRPIRSASKYCESTTHPVYHAKITVSTKNFPRSEGRKCGVKGLDQWRGLMVWSRSWFRTTGKGRERVRV